MQQELKKQIILTIILAAIFVGLVLFLLWMRKGVIAQIEQTNEYQQRLASIEADRSGYEKEYAEFQALKIRTNEIQKNFYEQKTIPLFLADVEAEAAKQGLDFEITSVDVVPREEVGNQLMVQFRSSGSYQETLAFTDAMEQKPYNIVFDEYYLTGGAASADPKAKIEWQLFGKMRLTTFK